MRNLHKVLVVSGVVGLSLAPAGCGTVIGIHDVPNPAGDNGVFDATVGPDGSQTPGGSGSGGGSGGSDGSGASGEGGVTPSGEGGVTPSGEGGVAPSGDSGVTTSVIEFHNDPARDGHYIDPLMTKAYAANLHFDPTFVGTSAGPGVPITGPMRAQVLYVQNGVAGKGTYYVADGSNDIYAIDEATGNTDWSKTPIITPAGTGQCPGDLQPLGITSTPYIDLASRTMYLAAATGTASGINTYYVYAFSIDTGDVVTGWPLDMTTIKSSTGLAFAAGAQNQRGGLSLLNGYLYVSFGGQDGDCGNYHGWVVSIPVANPTGATGFATAAQGGGIWNLSGLASDGTDMFAVTGNNTGGSGTNWSEYECEAVLRFTNGTAFDPTQTTDYFTPQNWDSLGDSDLCGAGPLVLNVPGATPSALVVAMGKSGIMNLLDRSNLGGVGTGGTTDGLYSATIGSGNLRGSAAAYTTSTGTYVAVHNDGRGTSCPAGMSGDLIAVKISATNPPQFTTAWCVNSGGNGSPIVTTTDSSGSNAIVWIVAAGGSGNLTGWDGETGAAIFNGTYEGGTLTMASSVAWTPPIEANGKIIVGASDKVYALTGM